MMDFARHPIERRHHFWRAQVPSINGAMLRALVVALLVVCLVPVLAQSPGLPEKPQPSSKNSTESPGGKVDPAADDRPAAKDQTTPKDDQAERERQRIEADRLEQERLKREREKLEQEQRQQEKLEREKREQEALERTRAALVRETFLRDRQRFEEDLRRAREEQREREEQLRREEHLRKVDPDHGSFWRREASSRFGKDLVFSIPAGRVLILYKQKRPLQFMGARAHMHKVKFAVTRVMIVKDELVELAPLLKGLRGHFVFVSVPRGSGRSVLRSDSYELPRMRAHGYEYDIINIYSDGAGFLRVEAEQAAREGEVGDYYQWSVDNIYVER